MKLKFNKSDHTYCLDGKWIPALSNVLDFYFGEYQDFTNGKAAERGQYVHKACEYYAKGILGGVKEDLTGYINAFARFFKDNPGIMAGKPTTEHKTYITIPENISNNLINWMGCGMRIDLIFRQSQVVIEIKSGIPAKKHFFYFSREEMQLNTQIHAIASKKKPPNTWTGFLLYLKPDGEYRAVEKEYNFNLWIHFRMALHGWYNKNYDKENK